MRIPRSNFSPVSAFEHSDHGNSEKSAVSHAEDAAMNHMPGTATATKQVAGLGSIPAGDKVPAHIPLRSKQMNHNLAVKHWMDQDRTVKPDPVTEQPSTQAAESVVVDNSAVSGASQTIQPAVGENVASAPKPANPSLVMTTAQHIAYQGLSVREQFGSGQPVWKNAFALAENVRFTRTPENELLKLRAKLIEEFGAQDEMELSSLSDQAEVDTVAVQPEQAAEPVMVREEITPVTESASVQTSLNKDAASQPVTATVSIVPEVVTPVPVVMDVEPLAALVQEIDQQPESAEVAFEELSSEPQSSAVSPLGFLSDFAFWEFADLPQAMPVISQDAEISESLSAQIVEPALVAKAMQQDEVVTTTTSLAATEPEVLAGADEAVADGEGTAETLLDSILAMFRVVECHSTQEQGSEVAKEGSAELLQVAEVEPVAMQAESALVAEEVQLTEIAESITVIEDVEGEADESVSVLGSVSGFLPLNFSLSSYQLQTNFTAYGAQVETVAASSVPEIGIEDLAELSVEHRDEDVVTTPEQAAPVAAAAEAEIAPPANAAVTSVRSPANTVNLSIFSPTASENAAMISSQDYQYPSHHLLQEPVYCEGAVISQEMLQRSAGLLENILEDFGVRGEIIHVRPGPVVTLYEFEPAPGVKSSRVIGLADDIARSMSALSARVAVVPGRNVIGIELPNAIRETVYLRELIESPAFERTNCRLPLCLGKTIGGEPVIAELAKMPHLLVAGTTGSGKSVAINTMILSLLYRLKPEECRLIMIDPKMLELSIYDGIPHLLTPVVTDPKKAVVALKWTVREMEERYRKMSRLGVRNIDGYNARAASAREKGETVTCTVQAGFDKTTGEILYEEQEMDLTPMPYIVIIVDEMADLMMVAGKEIEGAIQRLAQMARAAGIHLIMATQRPSVDVITGTIKANFPTRISFQVTSKIDSRTILGEQGAESLLGQGDMLHMAGGGRIVRVHGPFVSDEEVEKVVTHLKEQGRPDYLSTVTADEDEVEAAEDDSAVFDKSELASDDGDDLYEKAVKIVLRDKKCSTSYIQRRLSIGYNRAASLVERMEQSGLVGAANHVGKREIIGSAD